MRREEDENKMAGNSQVSTFKHFLNNNSQTGFKDGLVFLKCRPLSQKTENVKSFTPGGNKNRILLHREAFEIHILQTEHLESMSASCFHYFQSCQKRVLICLSWKSRSAIRIVTKRSIRRQSTSVWKLFQSHLALNYCLALERGA